MAERVTGEFARFMIVGLSNFLVSYVTFLFFITILPKSPLSAGIAQAVSYSAGIVWSYYWNGRWTFRMHSTQGNAFMKFLLLQLLLMIISSFSIGVCVNQSSLAPGIIWVLVMCPVTVLNFLGTRHFVFQHTT